MLTRLPAITAANGFGTLVDRLFIYASSLLIFAETLNGFFLLENNTNISLSLNVKLLMLAVVVVRVVQLSRTKAAVVMMVAGYGAFATLFHVMDGSVAAGVVVGEIALYLKCFGWIVVSLYVLELIDRGTLGKVWINRIAIVYLLGLIANVLIGYLGVGFSTYGDRPVPEGLGFKGYIYAGNEMGSAMALAFAICFPRMLKEKKLRRSGVLAGLTLFAALSLATKTAIFAMFAILIVAMSCYASRRGISALAIAAGTLVPIMAIYVDLDATFIFLGRLSHFIENYGVVSAILSNRDVYTRDILSNYFANKPHLDLLLGLGRTGLSALPKDIIEIDFLDIIVWYGFAGFFLWFLCLLVFTGLIFTKPRNARDRLYFSIVWLLLIAISSFAGHFFVSGMTSFLIPYFIGYVYLVGLHEKYEYKSK